MLVDAHFLLLQQLIYKYVNELSHPEKISDLRCALVFNPHMLLAETLTRELLPYCSQLHMDPT